MKSQLLKKLALWMMVCAVVMGTALNLPVLKIYGEENSKKIIVTGEGAVSVEPDIAYVNFGVKTVEKEVKTAQKKNDVQMAELIALLKKLGIDDQDIKTSAYNIYSEQDYTNDYAIKGYSVSNNVEVTVRNLGQIGVILDQAVSAGANASSGIRFSIEDSTVCYEEALALALKNADHKSALIAKTLGVTIGLPLELKELSRSSYVVQESKSYRDSLAVGTPIETGMLVIEASVEATYAY